MKIARPLAALTLLAVLSACGAPSEQAESTTSSASPRQTQAPSAKPTPNPTPKHNPTPTPAAFVIDCPTYDPNGGGRFESLEEVWVALPTAKSCTAVLIGSGPWIPTPEQQAVIDTIAPHWEGRETPENAYGVALAQCANQAYDGPWVQLWARAAAMICPTAPHAATLAGRGDGSVFDSGGSRVVGQTVPAGTYRSTSPAENCYWERTTGGGDTIANDFVTFAADGVTVELRDGEGFTSSDCGIWSRIG